MVLRCGYQCRVVQALLNHLQPVARIRQLRVEATTALRTIATLLPLCLLLALHHAALWHPCQAIVQFVALREVVRVLLGAVGALQLVHFEQTLEIDIHLRLYQVILTLVDILELDGIREIILVQPH